MRTAAVLKLSVRYFCLDFASLSYFFFFAKLHIVVFSVCPNYILSNIDCSVLIPGLITLCQYSINFCVLWFVKSFILLVFLLDLNLKRSRLLVAFCFYSHTFM
jgi:hypothetical protein